MQFCIQSQKNENLFLQNCFWIMSVFVLGSQDLYIKLKFEAKYRLFSRGRQSRFCSREIVINPFFRPTNCCKSLQNSVNLSPDISTLEATGNWKLFVKTQNCEIESTSKNHCECNFFSSITLSDKFHTILPFYLDFDIFVFALT